MQELNSPEFDRCKQWIKNQRDHKIDWEKIKVARKKSEESLQDFLQEKIEEEFWPEVLDCQLWYELVDIQREAEEKHIDIQRKGRQATLGDASENSQVEVPLQERSSWQLYKKHLKEVAGFKDEDIRSIEDSSIKILKQLSLDTSRLGPVKGLVVGNVQSGKTANMSGLMAMAADWGWNLFIVLSGTIENLRKQTQRRIFNDLNHEGNLTWVQLDHPSKSSPVGSRAQDLHFESSSNMRYMTVCLKVKSRLEKLIEWLQVSNPSAANMKILVIDDEADQAGVNTGDVYNDSERKTINKLLINLVHCKTKKGEEYKGHYAAMNYISYTATPYANFLNEKGEKTLYPKNFIHALAVGNEYFGPEQLFGNGEPGNNSLDIIRNIPMDDKEEIINIHTGLAITIPKSMKDSLLWFICSVAVLRYRKYKKPVSMLIHTSQKQIHHEYIADAIKYWFEANRKDIPALCKALYEEEIKKFDKQQLRSVYSDYGRADEEIPDYPAFDDILPFITPLVKEITSIWMDEEGELQYSECLHMCIDNCSKNGTDDDGMFMRLSYPDSDSKNIPNFATAFIVIGGNTLSRGLTLEGLTATYFLRTVSQADTLMQMGRWFGYRKNYELLPRIWLTDITKGQFEFLTDLDNDLRDQLYEMSKLGKSPEDFIIAIKSSPKEGKLLLTSKNKMQMAETAECDFSGNDTQMTVYSKSKEKLENNIKIAEDFLMSLDDGKKSELNGAYYWEQLDFSYIVKNFFEKGFYVHPTSKSFHDMKVLEKWIDKSTKEGFLDKWTVIVMGNIISAATPDSEKWHIGNKYTFGKISRTAKIIAEETVNIGVLTSKKDYLSDVRQEMMDVSSWNKMKSSVNIFKEYRDYRREAKVEKTPLFIIYCIDKDSKASENSSRFDLNAAADMIGIAMVFPGTRGSKNTVVRVKIKDISNESRVDVNEN